MRVCWLLLGFATASAQTIYVSPDVPVDLGGGHRQAFDVVSLTMAGGGASSLLFDGTASGLQPTTNINALEVQADGALLFSTDAPIRVTGVWYEPRDVVRWDPAAGLFSLVLDGSGVGIPEGADIDALSRSSPTELVISFDSSVYLGTPYLPSDLIRYDTLGGFSTYWDSASAGLGAEDNLNAVAVISPTRFYASFDAPVAFGGDVVLPHEIASWDGGFARSYAEGPRWGDHAGIDALDLAPGPGWVPDATGSRPTTPLLVTKAAGGALALSWGPSCNPAAVTEYAIYEGSLSASFGYAHTARSCSSGASLNQTLTPDAGSRYFIVVPTNALVEGSYGRDSSLAERPAGVARCVDEGPDPACSS